jgi:DDE superfamily endonuclease
MLKEQITVMICSNSTGTPRVPLFLIGKAKNPRSLKNVKLPATSAGQKSSWMLSNNFVQWYITIIVLEVEKLHSLKGKSGPHLLLLDNAPTHPIAAGLLLEDGLFSALYLPPDATSLIQPIYQSVVVTMKHLYQKTIQ